MNTDA